MRAAAQALLQSTGGPQPGDPPVDDSLAGAAGLTLAAFMAVDTALAIVSPEGRIALSNPVFDLAFGDIADDLLLQRFHFDSCRQGGVVARPVTFGDDRTYWINVTALPEGWLVSATDITDRLNEGGHEAEQARTDSLTQLGNRLLFRERLADLLSQPSADRSDRAVLTIDLDRFKAINDTLGRSIGDALLSLVGKRIRSAVALDDIVARLDGDEFGVIQTAQEQPESAVLLAKRLVDLLSRPYLLEGQLINVTAFVGIALIADADLDVDQVLKRADLALHRAKQERYAGYRVFESAMDESMKARRALETDLRRALARREFALAYQPQVNLQARRVTGF
jgi:diguanylate cyclase (GGDEF)-like protein